MNRLDPYELFACIAADVPRELHGDLFVTGSLAAAYRFQAQLEGRAVNTKDADLVIHPAGNVAGCVKMASELLTRGWTYHFEKFFPQRKPEPVNALPVIRLFPPASHDYYLEFLGLPLPGQTEPKKLIPIEIDNLWYGLPCFRFFGLTSLNRLKSNVGIEYASPSMMALANLLAHREIGSMRIKSGEMKDLLRSAKDLGRVIALAKLAERKETETWLGSWLEALKSFFPKGWRELAACAGNGLRELLEDEESLEEAHKTTKMGLLNGMNVTAEMLKATGERLFVDVIEPLAELARI